MMRLCRFIFTFIPLIACGKLYSQASENLIPSGNKPLLEVQVDPVGGDDRGDGHSAPVKTIARAIRLAQPGTVIRLKPAVYRESADFFAKHGTAEAPIILDGQGSVLDGSEPIVPEEWESLGNGLYRKVKLLPRMDDAILMRWYFLFGDRMNRMDRCSKGPTAPLKKPADLQSGEWTYTKEDDAFYLKVAADTSLAAANIRYPLRSNGVSFSREGSHITIRNITARHVYNDGYNIHGAQRSLRFENISAIECGDDGFSAHEDAVCHIDGYTSIGNSTGLCDTGTSRTHYKNVLIRNCVGFDLYFIGLEHSLENAVVETSAVRPFVLDGGRLPNGRLCTLRMKNVVLRRVGGGPGEMRVGRAGALDAEQCTIQGVNVQVTPGGSMALRRSLVSGDPKPEMFFWVNTLWRAEANHYDVAFIRVGQQSFAPAKLEDFRRLVGGETDCTAGPLTAPLAGRGADEAALEKLTATRSAPPSL